MKERNKERLEEAFLHNYNINNNNNKIKNNNNNELEKNSFKMGNFLSSVWWTTNEHSKALKNIFPPSSSSLLNKNFHFPIGSSGHFRFCHFPDSTRSTKILFTVEGRFAYLRLQCSAIMTRHRIFSSKFESRDCQEILAIFLHLYLGIFPCQTCLKAHLIRGLA